MNKLIILSLIVVSSVATCLAQEKTKKLTKEEKAARRAEYYRLIGGEYLKPGSGKGAIGFVDVKNCVPSNEVATVIKVVNKQLHLNIFQLQVEKVDGLPSRELVNKLGLSVAVFIVDNPSLPVMLAAPEDRWSLVNIAKLRSGSKGDKINDTLLPIRIRGELQRAFAYVCGSGSSQYEGNLMNVTDINGLDSVNPDTTVYDAMMRCSKYLQSIGVTRPLYVSYEKAVREGWAATPTNDIQKAIWDKVHAPPEKPIKISFDKDKQKPAVK